MSIIRSWRLSGVIAVRGIVLWLCRQSDPVGWLCVHWGVRSTIEEYVAQLLPNGLTTSQPDLTAYTATALYHARRSHHSVVSSWWWAWNCPKHVEQFIKRNNVLYNVTSSWFCYLHLNPMVYSSVSQPLWDRGPVNDFFIRRKSGPNKFTRKYFSIF